MGEITHLQTSMMQLKLIHVSEISPRTERSSKWHIYCPLEALEYAKVALKHYWLSLCISLQWDWACSKQTLNRINEACWSKVCTFVCIMSQPISPIYARPSAGDFSNVPGFSFQMFPVFKWHISKWLITSEKKIFRHMKDWCNWNKKGKQNWVHISWDILFFYLP